MSFAGNTVLSGIQGFLPTIITNFGFSEHNFGLDWLRTRANGCICSQHRRADSHCSTVCSGSCSPLRFHVRFRPSATARDICCWRQCAGGDWIHVGHYLALYWVRWTDHRFTRMFSLLLAVPSNVHVHYFATFCTTAGGISTIALYLTWCKCLLHSFPNRA